MGRVKSEMFHDDLGPDDELVAKPLAHFFGSDPLAELTKSAEKVIDSARIVDEIRDCELPYGTFERQTFIREKVKELMNAINCK